jgi:hypothetical protein
MEKSRPDTDLTQPQLILPIGFIACPILFICVHPVHLRLIGCSDGRLQI